MSADYNKLYYNAVSFADLSNSVEFAPHFICPNCKAEWEPKQQFEKLPNTDINMNSQIAFQCPKCGVKITLYVAVHKTENLNDALLCISVKPIESNWWVTSETA